jgi:hypothetical protein
VYGIRCHRAAEALPQAQQQEAHRIAQLSSVQAATHLVRMPQLLEALVCCCVPCILVWVMPATDAKWQSQSNT